MLTHCTYSKDVILSPIWSNVDVIMLVPKTWVHPVFDPVISDLGSCHSFNAMKPKEMLSPSYFADSFDKAFASDYSETARI